MPRRARTNHKAPRQTMLYRPNPLARRPSAVPKHDEPSSGPDAPVLLVSEENDDAAVCRYLLEKEGLKVLRARNHREALQIVQREQPQLVVVDATLPDGEGYDLALELKLLPKVAPVPVIILSGVAENPQQREAATAWVRKPVAREKFCRTVRNALELHVRERVKQQRDRKLRLES